MSAEADLVPDYMGQPLGGFLELVSSEEPAPGGGAAAAVAVALAAGLTQMAARLSSGVLPEAASLARRAEEVRGYVAPLARADADAYGRVMAAYRSPRGAGRDDRIRSALSEAADVPLAVAWAGAEIAEVAARIAGEGNPNLEGDAVTAVLLAEAGTRAATRLTEINLYNAHVTDERLARADEFAKVAAAARRSVTGTPGRG